MGMMLIGFGLLGYLESILPKDSIWRTNYICHLIFSYGVLVLVLGPCYLIRWGIKRRITFPRTGYVALGVGAHHTGVNGGDLAAKLKKFSWVIFIVVGGIAAAVAAGGCYLVWILCQHASSTDWIVSAGNIGYLVFWVLLYAFWIWRMGSEYRWKWLMLSFMALGLFVIGLSVPGNFIEMARPVALFVGMVWVVSGLGTLCSYLRHTQPPTSETE